MKHLLKHPSHFTKLVALLLFLSFINCQKEDLNTTNQTEGLSSVSYKVTSLSKLTKLQPVVANIKKVSPKTNTYNRGFDDFLPLENIDTTKVIQYTDTTGYSTYTFKIESDDETSINFENLCLLETEQGYIAYILSYESDENWYFSEDNYTPEGDHVFNIPTYQGDITKYSLEREVIWSTKEENLSRNDYSMRSGGMYIEECMYSTYEECCNMYAGNPTGACHPRGARCQGPFGFNVSSSCQMVWISTGGNNDGGNNGGGDGTDPCLTTGTNIIDEQPISGIGAGCTPNEGTGVLPTLASDCNKLADLSNSPTYQLRMQELIANTTGNTEILYYGKTYDNGNTIYNDQERYEGQPDVVGVDAPFPSSKIDSFIHNHFNNGNGTLSVFSGSDLYSLYQLYINDKIDDLSNFVMIVVTPGNNITSIEDDTLYAITIANGTEFAAFGALYLQDPAIIDGFFNSNGISPNISTSLNEQRLAQLIKEKKLGMKLYRGDPNNLFEWTELKIKNNNTLIENNCN